MGIGFNVANAAFNQNRIIDDSVFNSTGTMTASQIDNFLNNFNSSCISTNKGFSAPEPIGYSPTNGFKYGSNVSAGRIISDAANVYGLNPRVLLVTLQKEQSLVTGSSGCSTLRYAAAVGYGCPDGGTTYSYSGLNLYSINGNTVTSVSGTCVNSSLKVGFSQQVIRAAWLLKFAQQRSLGNMGWNIQLRDQPVSGSVWDNSDDPQSCYSGPMTKGTFQTCPGGTSTYYDGLKTIDGSSVNIENGATAALYWYTPHFNGNQSFVTIWENWFGTGSLFTPSFAWQKVEMTVQDEGKNSEIPTNNMRSGERLYVKVKAKNTGSVTWYRSGPNPVLLATLNPKNVSSPYCDSSWATPCNRAAYLEEASVAPGDTGTFNFYAIVPNYTGEYRSYFSPVAEFQSWMSNDEGFHLNIINNNNYEWRWLYYEAYTDANKQTPVNINDLARGQQVYIVLHVKNLSATVWRNNGTNPATLGTSMPQDRSSNIYSPSWVSPNRAAYLDQSNIVPGQDGTFSFYIKTPQSYGVTRNYFKPVLEYKGWSRDDSNHIYLNVTR